MNSIEAPEECAGKSDLCDACGGSGLCQVSKHGTNKSGDCAGCGLPPEVHGSSPCSSCLGWGTKGEWPCYRYMLDDDEENRWCDPCRRSTHGVKVAQTMKRDKVNRVVHEIIEDWSGKSSQ